MMKRYACLLVVSLTVSGMAVGDTLRLPVNARIDVQVVDTLRLERSAPSRDNVLLKPAPPQDATSALPAHCLITATARLVEDRMRFSANSLTCIEAMGDTREIFSGDLSAAAFDADGEFGISATCTASGEDGCQRAELRPSKTFQLELGKALTIEAQGNPSARLNEQRRQASSADNSPNATSEGAGAE